MSYKNKKQHKRGGARAKRFKVVECDTVPVVLKTVEEEVDVEEELFCAHCTVGKAAAEFKCALCHGVLCKAACWSTMGSVCFDHGCGDKVEGGVMPRPGAGVKVCVDCTRRWCDSHAVVEACSLCHKTYCPDYWDVRAACCTGCKQLEEDAAALGVFEPAGPAVEQPAGPAVNHAEFKAHICAMEHAVQPHMDDEDDEPLSVLVQREIDADEKKKAKSPRVSASALRERRVRVPAN